MDIWRGGEKVSVGGKSPTHLVSEVLWWWKQLVEELTYLCLEVRIRKAMDEISLQE